MRLGVIPEGIVDGFALVSGRLPGPLLEVFWGGAMCRTILAGIRLGIFESLVKYAKSADEVARETGCDAQAMETLLNALNGFGYLKRRSGKYSLDSKAARWLIADSSYSMRDSVLFIAEVLGLMDDIEGTVRTGRTQVFHDPSRPPEFWEKYMRGLATFARYTSPEISRKVKPDVKPERLLDVGGGHGIYSIAFCRRHPGLKAEILELAPAAEHGRQIVKEHGFEDRVTFRDGDFRTEDWGEGFDLVLMFNIIHNVSKEEVPGIMEKAYNALRPGGKAAVLDSEHQGGEKDLSATAGVNELMFFVINGLRVYPEDWIRGWMKGAGFKAIEKKRLLTMPMTLFLTGRK